MPHDRFVGVVWTSLLAGAIEYSLHQRFVIVAGEVQYQFYVDITGDHLALGGVAWDAVEQQHLAGRIERSAVDQSRELFTPQRDGEVVGDEVSARCEFGHGLSVGRIGVEPAEDLSTGEMKETGQAAQDDALGPLSTSGCAKQQNGGGSWVRHRVGPA